MNCEAVREQIPAYVLGALTPREQSRLEGHVRGCPDCALELQESLAAARGLAALAPQTDPSPTVKARLLGRIRKQAQPRRGGLFSRPALGWQTALAGSLGLLLAALVGVGLMVNREMNGLESQTQGLQELVEAQRQEIRDMAESQTEAVVVNTQAARRQYVLVSMLATPDIHVFWAERSEEYPQVRGMVLTSPDQRWGLLAGIGLKALPADQEHRVWLQRNGEFVYVGTLTVDDTGWGQTTLRPSQPLSDFQGILVTIEPLEGIHMPIGPAVFSATMAQTQ